MDKITIDDFLGVLTAGLVISGRIRTANAYAGAVRKARQILGEDAPFSEVFSLDGIHRCERVMRAEALNPSTVSFYLRALHAIYNKGVKMGVCAEIPHLFAGVYTGITTTPKRAVSPLIFGRLQMLDLSGKENLAFARDTFLLSYCLQGIPFVDLSLLRKSNLKGDVLTYCRAKTGSSVTVALSDMAIEIIEQYAPQTEGLPYLFPIIKNPDKDLYLQHRSALRTYNRRLKKLAELAHIDENLTSYTARHTWATTARNMEVPMGVISEGLGHQAEKTTRIYLAGFDRSALLQANEKVLKAANLVCGYKTVGKATLTTDEETLSGEEKDVSLLGRDGQFRQQT